MNHIELNQYKIDLAQRAKNLKNNMPLKVPFSLLLDVTNRCNFRCVTCPTGNEALLGTAGRVSGMMPLSLYKKVIDEIAQMGKLKRLGLYKDGEPLLHTDLPEMIRYAKESKIAEIVNVTTNASLLTPEKSKQILESGLDELRISLAAMNTASYREITQVSNISYESIKNNILNFLSLRNQLGLRNPTVVVQMIQLRQNQSQLSDFLDLWGKWADEVQIEPWMEWDGQAQVPKDGHNSPVLEDIKRYACPIPWYSLAINWDGDVSVCCVDWAKRAIVGNIRKESFPAVWNGEKLRRFRLYHIEDRFEELEACKHCTYWRAKEDISLWLKQNREKALGAYSNV